MNLSDLQNKEIIDVSFELLLIHDNSFRVFDVFILLYRKRMPASMTRWLSWFQRKWNLLRIYRHKNRGKGWSLPRRCRMIFVKIAAFILTWFPWYTWRRPLRNCWNDRSAAYAPLPPIRRILSDQWQAYGTFRPWSIRESTSGFRQTERSYFRRRDTALRYIARIGLKWGSYTRS